MIWNWRGDGTHSWIVIKKGPDGLLAQHLADSTPPPPRQGNAIRAAVLLAVSMVVVIGGALLSLRGCP